MFSKSRMGFSFFLIFILTSDGILYNILFIIITTNIFYRSFTIDYLWHHFDYKLSINTANCNLYNSCHYYFL
jgi:hypothetical protein